MTTTLIGVRCRYFTQYPMGDSAAMTAVHVAAMILLNLAITNGTKYVRIILRLLVHAMPQVNIHALRL